MSEAREFKHTTTKEKVAELVAQIAMIPHSEVMQLFRANPLRLPAGLKLVDLKHIGRFLGLLGYNVPLSMNKGPLLEHLCRVLTALPFQDPNATNPYIPPYPHYAQQYSNQTSNSALISEALASIDRAKAQIANTPKPAVLPKANTVTATPKAAPQFAKPVSSAYPINVASSSTGSTHSSSSSTLAARIAELNSKKRSIYYEAMQINGMTEHEVLDALKFCSTADCSIDMVIERVVIKRSHSNNPADDANIEALERALYDRVALESEKERDNIQARKRQKVNEIKHDVQSAIMTFDDFEPSVLLFGLSGNNGGKLPATDANSASQSVQVSKLYLGSSLLRILTLLFDYSASDSHQDALIEVISSNLATLRTAVVEILLLEKDALRFYKTATHGYLLYLMHRLDAALDDESSSVSSVSAASSSSSSSADVSAARKIVEKSWHRKVTSSPEVLTVSQHLTNAEWRRLFDVACAHQTRILQVLHEMRDNFLRGTVKIPRDGKLLPELFRLKSLLPYLEAMNSTVEDDGFAVSEDCQYQDLLSDRESVQDLDDDDDDGDY